jgi:hypothetical protein
VAHCIRAAYPREMPSSRALGITLVISVVVAIGFAFTVIGMAGEAVAILALAGLALRGAMRLSRHAR